MATTDDLARAAAAARRHAQDAEAVRQQLAALSSQIRLPLAELSKQMEVVAKQAEQAAMVSSATEPLVAQADAAARQIAELRAAFEAINVSLSPPAARQLVALAQELDDTRWRVLTEVNSEALRTIAEQFATIKANAPTDLIARQAQELGHRLNDVLTAPVVEALRQVNEQATAANLLALERMAAQFAMAYEALPAGLRSGLNPPELDLTPEASRALFEQQVRSRLGMSGDEFLRRWDAGEFEPLVDDPDHPELLDLAALLPIVR